MRRARHARRALVAVAAALLVSGGATLATGARRAACACGGPEFYDIDAPLAGPERWITDVTVADEFEATPVDELRFLAPFRATDSSRVAPLWQSAYGWVDPDSVVTPPGIAVAPLDAALRAGDLSAATRRAHTIVDAVLDLPAPLADAYQNELRRAVELLELAPALQPLGAADARLTARVLATDTNAHAVAANLGALPEPLGAAVEVRRLARRLARRDAAAFVAAHPRHLRAPSLRWVALQERMRAEIPDGWANETRDKVAPGVWRSLDDAHARWLADYPAHPLADLVRLSRVRVAYHEGDSTRAWRLATEPWPRHLPRLLGELRVLAIRGMVAAPESLSGAAARDLRLRSAMLTVRAPSRDEWDALWRAAEDSVQSIRRPWAINLQERLLDQAAHWAADSEPLPARFPTQAMTPASRSRLWARLRMIALYAAGDTAGAARQADALGTDAAAALVRTRLALGRRQFARAAREPLLERDARGYLVRVLLPDSALSAVLDARPLGDSTRADAALALGASLAARGGWRAGVPALARGGRALPSGLAARWQRAAALDADTSLAGRLAYARWLAGQRGRLFFGVDNAWLRSLGWREQALTDTGATHPPSPLAATAEAEAIRAHLLRTTEPYLALRAYGEWLARAESRPALRAERREVAREADRVYNLLVNWDAYNTKFWQRQLEQSPEARAIRRAGR